MILPSDEEHIEKQVARLKDDAQAIADSTSTATAAILDVCDQLKKDHADNKALLDAVTVIYQECATQDLTNQRVQRILRAANRILDPNVPEDDALLEGPQNNASLGQDDINRLLDESN